MRRRTLLLAAGLLAYYLGATVRVYLRSDEELCGCGQAECRILLIAENWRAALSHPLIATGYLVTPNCSN
jgi:hypothetical protein